MPMEETTTCEVVLPNGRTVVIQSPALGGQDRDVGLTDKIPIGDLAADLEGLSSALIGAVRAVAPSEAELELSVGVEAETGRLMVLLADGALSAGIKIRFLWKPQD
jgi:Trypsin-co-occurring domain 1